MADEFWKKPNPAIEAIFAETWRLNEDTAGELDVYLDLDDEGTCRRILATDSANDDDKARAKLAAAAPEMARLLRAKMFFRAQPDAWYCIACGWRQDHDPATSPQAVGHSPSCELVAVLTKAGASRT